MILNVEFEIKDVIYNGFLYNFLSFVEGERRSNIISVFDHQGRNIVFNDLDFQEALAENLKLHNYDISKLTYEGIDCELIRSFIIDKYNW